MYVLYGQVYSYSLCKPLRRSFLLLRMMQCSNSARLKISPKAYEIMSGCGSGNGNGSGGSSGGLKVTVLECMSKVTSYEQLR